MTEEIQIKDWKKDKVKELSDLIKKYPVIGLINLENLPSNQLQSIRGNLRNDVLIKTSKKAFFQRAFEETGNPDLLEKVKGSPAIILSKNNPFKIYKLIQKNKSKSAIKPGQIAPIDLIVPAGETPFAPGPIIGELGQIGVKAKIVGGKISVLKDAVVVKQGEPAGDLAASILLKLGIKPIEIGLNVIAIKEDGIIYTPDMLSIDAESMIINAYIQAKNLVLNTGLIVKDLIGEILTKAQLSALILNGIINPDQAIKMEAPSNDATIKTEAKKEEEPEEEEVSTEEAAAGLGALFG